MVIAGILVCRDGKARVWNRPKGVKQSEMARLLALAQVLGADAVGLAPPGPGLVVSIPSKPGSLAEALRQRGIATYDLVNEVSGLA